MKFFSNYTRLDEYNANSPPKTKTRRGADARRATMIGDLPSDFPFDTHIAQLVWADVVHEEVRASQGEQEQDANEAEND